MTDEGLSAKWDRLVADRPHEALKVLRSWLHDKATPSTPLENTYMSTEDPASVTDTGKPK